MGFFSNKTVTVKDNVSSNGASEDQENIGQTMPPVAMTTSTAVDPTANKDPVENTKATEYLDANEQQWLHKIHEKLLTMVDLSRIVHMPAKQARAQIREISTNIIDTDNVPLSTVSRARVVRGIEDELLGLGPLEPLLADKTIADILVNRHDSVYVERRGRLEETGIKFRDDTHLINIIDRIVSNVGRRIDESSPMVDARLKDGSRVNAIIPPLAIDGPTLSIRRFTVDKLSIEQLVEYGSITEQLAVLLQAIVKARLNILVSGGTGSGKTTLLNVLSNFISPRERVITIEDSAELQLQQPHIVRLETRPPNIEGKGEVAQRELLKNTLRMRPDRIIVGEVRGPEALDMLQAMNTGHDGSLATIHANNPRDALSRLENMVSMSDVRMPMTATRSQIASALDIVVQLERMEDGRRRLTSLQEVQGMEGDIITLSEIFRFRRTGMEENGDVKGHFEATGMVPKFNDQLKTRGMGIDLSVFKPDSASARLVR